MPKKTLAAAPDELDDVYFDSHGLWFDPERGVHGGISFSRYEIIGATSTSVIVLLSVEGDAHVAVIKPTTMIQISDFFLRRLIVLVSFVIDREPLLLLYHIRAGGITFLKVRRT